MQGQLHLDPVSATLSCSTGHGLDWSPHLVQGISGAFRPRTLTALMGVTGAGKTTLMDVLACRKTGIM